MSRDEQHRVAAEAHEAKAAVCLVESDGGGNGVWPNANHIARAQVHATLAVSHRLACLRGRFDVEVLR